MIFLIAIYAEVIKKKERKKAQGYQYRKQRITVLQKTEFEEKNELLKERCEISFLQQSHLAQKSLLGLCQKRQKKNTAKSNMRPKVGLIAFSTPSYVMLHFHGLELYLVISLIYSRPFAALLMQVIRDERYNKMKVTKITSQAEEIVQKNVALSLCRNRHSMVCQNDEQKCFFFGWLL